MLISDFGFWIETASTTADLKVPAKISMAPSNAATTCDTCHPDEIARETDDESAFAAKDRRSRFLSRMQDRNDRPREDFPVYWWAGPKAHVALRDDLLDRDAWALTSYITSDFA